MPVFFFFYYRDVILKRYQVSCVISCEPYIFFEVKSFIFRRFSKIWKFSDHCEVIKSKLGQTGTKFEYYIPTAIKISNSVTMSFTRLRIHFWDQSSKTVILWPIPNPSLWRHARTASKDAQICISSTIGKKRWKPIGNAILRWGKCLWG